MTTIQNKRIEKALRELLEIDIVKGGIDFSPNMGDGHRYKIRENAKKILRECAGEKPEPITINIEFFDGFWAVVDPIVAQLEDVLGVHIKVDPTGRNKAADQQIRRSYGGGLYKDEILQAVKNEIDQEFGPSGKDCQVDSKYAFLGIVASALENYDIDEADEKPRSRPKRSIGGGK